MFATASNSFQSILDEIRDSGLYKEERVLVSPQDAAIAVQNTGEVSNNPPLASKQEL